MFQATRFRWFRAGVSSKIEIMSGISPGTLHLLKNLATTAPQKRPITQFLHLIWKEKTLNKETKYITGAIAVCVFGMFNSRAAFNNPNTNISYETLLSIEEESHGIIDAYMYNRPEQARQAMAFDFITNTYTKWQEMLESDPLHQEIESILG